MSDPVAPSAAAAPAAAPSADPKAAPAADPKAPAPPPYKVLKVNGKDLPVESAEKLEELARLGASSTERFEAAKRAKEEAAADREFSARIRHALQNDPEGLLEALETKFGHGERLAKFYETKVGRMVREQIETPEERAARLEREELEQYRTRAQREKAQAEQAGRARAVQEQAAKWSSVITSVATEAGFDMSDADAAPFITSRLALEIQGLRDAARERGVQLTRGHVVDVAKRLYDKMERGRESKWLEKLRATPDDKITETFGEDLLKRIRAADLARVRGGGVVPSAKVETAPKEEGRPNGGRPKTFSNFEDLLRDRRKSAT